MPWTFLAISTDHTIFQEKNLNEIIETAPAGWGNKLENITSVPAVTCPAMFEWNNDRTACGKSLLMILGFFVFQMSELINFE